MFEPDLSQGLVSRSDLSNYFEAGLVELLVQKFRPLLESEGAKPPRTLREETGSLLDL